MWISLNPFELAAARAMARVLNLVTICPVCETAMIPPWLGFRLCLKMWSAACWRESFLYCMSAESRKAMAFRMNSSPTPVHETAQVLLSA